MTRPSKIALRSSSIRSVYRRLYAAKPRAHNCRGLGVHAGQQPESRSKWRHIPALGPVTGVTAHRGVGPVLTTLSYIVVSMSTTEQLGSLNAPQRKAVTYGEP